MKSNQNIVIVLLLISTAVLGAILIGDYFAQEARAGGTTSSPAVTVVRTPNIYTMCTGTWDANIDILYVLDVNAQKLNAYVANIGRGLIELHDGVSLPQAFRGRR